MAYFEYDDRYGCRVASPTETTRVVSVSPEAAAANKAQWEKAAPEPKETAAVQGSLGSLLAGAGRRRK